MGFMNTTGAGLDNAQFADSPFGDMTIESQDIDTRALGEDMTLWLDLLPPDVQYFFDQQNPSTMDFRDSE